ncbi:hypothetical protein BH11CYA1_BH11CYA1_07460 [soil metagenome]
MTPIDTQPNVVQAPTAQAPAVQAPSTAKPLDMRRKKQARFFSELRVLKTASRLTLEQNEFACGLVNGFQQGDIAALNRLVAASTFTHEELQGAVAGAQRVLDACNLIVAIEWHETEPSGVRLWARHSEFGSVSIGAIDSQFDCVDSAQDLAIRAISERISDFFVMY